MSVLLLFVLLIFVPETLQQYSCGHNYVATTSRQQLGFPYSGSGRYPDYTDCSWEVTSSIPGYKIRLNFINFYTERCCDYLSISEGGRQITQLRGRPVPTPKFVSNSGRIGLRFHSDGSVAYSGFRAYYFIVQCPTPVIPVNGFVNYESNGSNVFTYNTTVTYSCRRGYILVGNSTGRCNDDSDWGEIPSCKVIGCEAPIPPVHGSLTTKRVQFVYKTEPVTSLPDNGSGTEPLSTFADIATTTGAIAGSTTASPNIFGYNSVVTYSCDPDYIMDGNATGICNEKEEWGKAPICRNFRCLRPTPPDHGSITTKGNEFNLNSEIMFSCDVGYRMEGNSKAKCNENETWDGIPICRGVRCSPPSQPQHGSVNTQGIDFTYNNKVTYSCDAGYMIKGNKIRTCNENQTWGEMTTCVVIRCPPPIPPEHGSVDTRGSDFMYKSKVTFACDDGYKLDGNRTGQCNDNINWGEIRVCREIRCKVPTWSENGTISTKRSSVGINETITYSCTHPYLMKNQPSNLLTTTCFSNGSWSMKPPTCYKQIDKCLPNGVYCKFPIHHNGQTYNQCIKFPNSVRLQCQYPPHSEKLWGYCETCKGAWYKWSKWTSCSKTCGIGKQRRRRTCSRLNNPAYHCPGASEQVRECTGGFIYTPAARIVIGSSIYEVFKFQLSFNDSRGHCQSLGGDLALIKNSTINEQLFSSIQKLKNRNNGPEPLYFFGLTDQVMERNWMWIDGTPANYTNWNVRPPYPTRWENCAILRGTNGKWQDAVCGGTSRNDHFHICQRNGSNPLGMRKECSASCKARVPPEDSSPPGCSNCSNLLSCSHNEIRIGRRIFSFVQTAEIFSVAKGNCQRLGGDLVMIKDYFLQRQIAYKIKTLLPNPFQNQTSYYIGISEHPDRNLYWMDGTLLYNRSLPTNHSQPQYQNWFQPPNRNRYGIEECGTIDRDTGIWNITRCANKLFYICEREAGCVVPRLVKNGYAASIAFSVRFNETITYKCKNGYEIAKGSRSVSKCLLNGSWSNDVPVCIKSQKLSTLQPSTISIRPQGISANGLNGAGVAAIVISLIVIIAVVTVYLLWNGGYNRKRLVSAFSRQHSPPGFNFSLSKMDQSDALLNVGGDA